MSDFDVVVVGGGSAGCVLASRLCQSNLDVCLVEAGPDYGRVNSGRWPSELLDARRKPASHDWGYAEQSRAKVIGGCSTHNQCAAVWGMPYDYDGWADSGVGGWRYSEIAPLIDVIEKVLPEPPTPYRGRSGNMPTRPYRDDELATWQRFFLESTVGAGFARLVDLSAPTPEEGVMAFHANVTGSVRWNAAFAFLDPVRDRGNLTIFGETLVDKLVMSEGRALVVLCRKGGNVLELTARRFVLCAGTYGSPSILMRSGIGSARHLEGLDIPVQVDLPGVGENLHDHPGVILVFEPSKRGRQELEEDLAQSKFHESQVILRARSMFCENGFDVHIVPYQFEASPGEWVFGILVSNMTPLSRGRVLLRGQDPFLQPKIEFGFLTDSENRDVAVIGDGVNVARRIASIAPLVGAISREVEPGQDASEANKLYSYIRSNVASYAHPVGTCKMGIFSDASSVVDTSYRVRGTSNVYVADASVIPRIPHANTNLTCFLIGLHAANLLLSDEA